MISEKNNMSSQERLGELSDVELDSETWGDQETLVDEDNPGEGGSSSGDDLCLRSEVGTDLGVGDSPVCGPVTWKVFRALTDMLSFAGNTN
jgi:hypothetical protein